LKREVLLHLSREKTLDGQERILKIAKGGATAFYSCLPQSKRTERKGGAASEFLISTKTNFNMGEGWASPQPF
jgi:hypothetical protein